MRGRSSGRRGLVMPVIAVAVVLFLILGTRWLLQTRQAPDLLSPVQSGPLPQALAEEMKRNEHASYLRGMKDAVEFWRVTGVLPDTPNLREVLWARRQASENPLTPAEAQSMLQRLVPDTEP